MAGYSGTPLWKKLGLKDGMTCAVHNAPEGYETLLGAAPDVVWGQLAEGTTFVHLFVTEATVLSAELQNALQLIDRNGMIWVSWPKRTSKVPTDITEDTIRSICLPMGLVDVKVCAVDATWSGLKLMIRKELR
ncbi:DUF3052 family protein [Flavimaricola marinus]|uniref:DUF3052 domain-containing protein n=1 Tax=Flavimaricola marinus TaxID=1819565 RepID=A0A238L925_9RHOB|nr:DUF3052 family protein [Flavimaricola marinus]SMY06207.1 hypothetical protein LOM8899_00329 [Flavimaricola marinus]